MCGKTHALGCTRLWAGPPSRCVVAIAPDDELMGWDYRYVLRHEIGHCNGWKHLPSPPATLNRNLEQWCKESPALLICRGG
jgi:hypothetical protein